MSKTPVILTALMTGLTVFGCATATGQIVLIAGEAARPAGPASTTLPKAPAAGQVYDLKCRTGTVTAQADHQGRLWWWQPEIPAGQSVTYKVAPADAQPAQTGKGVEVIKAGDGVINVSIDGKLFTALNFKSTEPKVYLYPVIGPTDKPVTRHFPMKMVEGERQDHHHHRSIWTAHGDIRVGDFDKANADDYWAEPAVDKKTPPTLKPIDELDRQVLKRVTRMVSGPVFGQIEAEIDWISHKGKKDLTETRTYTFFRTDGRTRIIDLQVLFTFTEGDTMFGDTKEGGMCALRILTSMDEQKDEGESRTGQMCNAGGQVGEKQCWGQPAEWCDYVGPVDGDMVGIAVMDAPGSFRYPARWHIRAYGLYTANPFGTGSFTKGQQDGTHVFKKGETTRFNYRILIHTGDTKAARIAEQYRIYAETARPAAGK